MKLQTCKRHPNAPRFVRECSGCKQDLHDLTYPAYAITRPRATTTQIHPDANPDATFQLWIINEMRQKTETPGENHAQARRSLNVAEDHLLDLYGAAPRPAATQRPMPALLVNVRRELGRFHLAGTITRLIPVGTGVVVVATTPGGETEVVGWRARPDSDVAQDAAEWPEDEPDRIGFVYARTVRCAADLDAGVYRVVAHLTMRLAA